MGTKKVSVRKVAILLLLTEGYRDFNEAKPIKGITRLQKLLFLVNREIENLSLGELFDKDFHYVAEKFGPADLDLYADIDYLVAREWVSEAGESGLERHSLDPEDAGVWRKIVEKAIPDMSMEAMTNRIEEQADEELSFEYLLGVSPDELLLSQAEKEGEAEYLITRTGWEMVRDIESAVVTTSEGGRTWEALAKACLDVRQSSGSWSLTRLLEYIYKNFPEMTEKSTIRDRILGSYQ